MSIHIKMKTPNNKIINRIVEEKIPCVFVSPHLDDAILSAGDLIAYLSKRTTVEVVNVFTKPSPRPYTLSARSFLRQCGYKDADKLFQDRTREDIKVFSALGIKPHYLDFVDSTWRKIQNIGFIRRVLGKIIPELNHIYPVHRLHIINGRVSSKDKAMTVQLSRKLETITSKYKKFYVFCPLAINSHVDHTVVRNVCTKTFKNNLIFWSDFPYNVQRKIDKQEIDKMKLKLFLWRDNIIRKKKLISGYKSQFRTLFPNNYVPLISEIYYVGFNK